MTNAMKWKTLLVVGLVAVSIWKLWPPDKSINLGLDLKGGMHLVMEVDTSKLSEAEKRGARERALEIIRRRVDEFGVSEPVIIPEGENRIVVQLPGVTDRERAYKLIGKTALLEFRLVSADQEKIAEAQKGTPPIGYELAEMPADDGPNTYRIPILIKSTPELTGAYLADAQPNFGGAYNEPEISITFNGEGSKRFAQITEAYVGRQLAILLDGEVIMAPQIKTIIPNGRGVITGNFTASEVKDTALLLRAGALPAPVKIIEDRTVSATLGRDSIVKGVTASIAGLILVVIFMGIYYLQCGWIANLALLLNIVILIGTMAWFKFTLTLPGIAGIILTLGMAVDANVLIFERMREEMATGKGIRSVIAKGYEKAFSAIFDSNLTTLLSGIILFIFGTGPVKGFAVTLSIGIATSMFTALVVTRLVFDYLTLNPQFNKIKFMQMIKLTNIDFMSKGLIAISLSALFIAIGMGALAVRGKSMLGLDFTGGSMVQLKFEKSIAVEKIRKALDELGVGGCTIQHSKDKDTDVVMIKAGLGKELDITKKLPAKLPNDKFEVLRSEEVGPAIGKDLRKKAIIAVILSIIGIGVYLWFRFELKYGVGAIISLLHDALFTVGAMAIVGREIDLTIIAALLTVIGYSVNDTIVIFDRVRENFKMMRKTEMREIFNVSINQTLSRTLLTSLTVFLVLLALYFFGGEVINNFAFALVVGCAAGVYSTMFIASPVVLWWAHGLKAFKKPVVAQPLRAKV